MECVHYMPATSSAVLLTDRKKTKLPDRHYHEIKHLTDSFTFHIPLKRSDSLLGWNPESLRLSGAHRKGEVVNARENVLRPQA